MTELERHAIRKAVENHSHPSAPGGSFSFTEGHKEEVALVPGKKNVDLLDSEEYKAGYRHCAKQFAEVLEFIMTASARDIRRYAGRPERTKK